MAERKLSGFQPSPPDFSVGTYVVYASPGWSCLLRVEKHDNGKAKARVVRSGGEYSLTMKPSTVTRAVMTRDEANAVLERLKTRPLEATARDERMKRCLKAQKSLNPFVKSDALSELALVREAGTEFWNDDKVFYGRLRQQLADELSVSLDITGAELDGRLAAVGVP